MNKTNSVPKALAVHDLSGFGRASLLAAIPIISNFGIQVCPIPTALLSTHTSEFEDFSFLDLSPEMKKIVAHWQKLDLKFDALYSGFLGSSLQTKLVVECIDTLCTPEALILIDPVLGDSGNLYTTIDQVMIENMRQLIKKADIITPNLTETGFLLGGKYQKRLELLFKQKHKLSKTEIIDWLEELTKIGAKTIIITGVILDDQEQGTSSVLVLDQKNKEKKQIHRISCEYIPAEFPGTGDIFASVLTGSLLCKEELPVAIARAMHFIATGIKESLNRQTAPREGILLELILRTLREPISSTYSETWTI